MPKVSHEVIVGRWLEHISTEHTETARVTKLRVLGASAFQLQAPAPYLTSSFQAVDDERSPAGLMAGAEAAAGVAVEVLVE